MNRIMYSFHEMIWGGDKNIAGNTRVLPRGETQLTREATIETMTHLNLPGFFFANDKNS